MPAAVASVLAVALRRNSLRSPRSLRIAANARERVGSACTRAPTVATGTGRFADQLHHPTLRRRVAHNGLAELVDERRERVRRRHTVKHDSPPEGSHAVVRTTASLAFLSADIPEPVTAAISS